MSNQTAAASEQIERRLRTLRRIADNTADRPDAEAIHVTAGDEESFDANKC